MMARRISEIKPENVEDHIIKFEYALRLMNNAVQAATAIARLDVPDHLVNDKERLNKAMEFMLAGLRGYRDEQRELLYDYKTKDEN